METDSRLDQDIILFVMIGGQQLQLVLPQIVQIWPLKLPLWLPGELHKETKEKHDKKRILASKTRIGLGIDVLFLFNEIYLIWLISIHSFNLFTDAWSRHPLLVMKYWKWDITSLCKYVFFITKLSLKRYKQIEINQITNLCSIKYNHVK